MTAVARDVPAQEWAAGRIRLALDSACVPDVQGIADESGLSVAKVEAIRDAILSGKRQHQTLGRPRAATAPNLTRLAVAGSRPGPAEPSLATSALAHPDARIKRLARQSLAADERARTLDGRLRDALREWSQAEEKRRTEAAERAEKAARIAALTAELDTLRETVTHPCPRCERTFAHTRGLSRHLHYTHGVPS